MNVNEVIEVSQKMNAEQELKIKANEHLINELTEKLSVTFRVIDRALKIEDLWLPNTTDIEHEEEAKALYSMRDQFISALHMETNKTGISK